MNLNSGSEIRYPERFPASSREVHLSGEAAFQVAKDSARPFTVRTPQAWTRVLGTLFNVRAYAGEASTTEVVREGKVGFAPNASAHPAVFLTSGLRGRWDAGGKGLATDSVDADDFLAWKDNRLVFADRSLREIAPVLERWYGIEVEITSESLAAQRFTGRFQKPRLDRLLESMADAIGFRYAWNGKGLVLRD